MVHLNPGSVTNVSCCMMQYSQLAYKRSIQSKQLFTVRHGCGVFFLSEQRLPYMSHRSADYCHGCRLPCYGTHHRRWPFPQLQLTYIAGHSKSLEGEITVKYGDEFTTHNVSQHKAQCDVIITISHQCPSKCHY